MERMGSGAAASLVIGLPIGVLLWFQRRQEAGGSDVSVGIFIVGVTVTGAVIGAVLGNRPRGLAAAAAGGGLIGLLGWLVFALSGMPLLHAQWPTWSVQAAARAYPSLVGDLLDGTVTGVVVHGLLEWRARRAGKGAVSTVRSLSRVVIVGGGFAGLTAAQRFERLALRGVPVDVTLISASNFLLFTPMLAEVASGALEPAHISAPVRASVSHTRFRRGTVQDIDLDTRAVALVSESGVTDWVPFDHLILAAGSVPSFLNLPGVEEHATTVKDLGDAVALREKVIGLLERADQSTSDPGERERLLTFVVAGGGFAGTEVIAELFDLVHGVLHLFPGITTDEPRFVLIHAQTRILPELSAELGAYALDRLQARGIVFRLGVRVAAASAHEVVLSDGERISTVTFVWTAGNQPSPLVRTVRGAHAAGRALVTDPQLRVVGLDRIWALGDCAEIPDLDNDGAPFPPTAQHALRQGRAVADNVAAVLTGREPIPFRFHAIGTLVALGHRTAVAEIYGHQFAGFLAWLLWRGIYLAKLPRADKRVRVFLDWGLDLVFPRDIVLAGRPSPTQQTPDSSASGGQPR